MRKRVLLIDDDPVFIRRIQSLLEASVDVQVVSVADEAIRVCTTWRPDLILLDVHIAPGDSFQILDDITGSSIGAPISVLCLSRGAGSATRLQSFGDAVFGILKREVDQSTLLAAVSQALDAPEMVAA